MVQLPLPAEPQSHQPPLRQTWGLMAVMHMVGLDNPSAALWTPDHSYGLHLRAQDLEM